MQNLIQHMRVVLELSQMASRRLVSQKVVYVIGASELEVRDLICRTRTIYNSGVTLASFA